VLLVFSKRTTFAKNTSLNTSGDAKANDIDF